MSFLGFSTGALFRDQLAASVQAVRDLTLSAIELSSLRKHELPALVEFVRTADLTAFTYISIHAPTDFLAAEEADIVRTLLELSQNHNWSVVIHPDCIFDVHLWEPFGDSLCIENMDKRKPIGRTAEELRQLFLAYPRASLCFDIGHAHQVDTSMTEAYRILREFGSRICQLHISEVTSNSKHDTISEAVLSAFMDVATLLPKNVPVILETPVNTGDAEREIAKVTRLFETTFADTHA